MPGRRSNYRPGPSASSAAAGITFQVPAKKAPAVIPETNFLVTHPAVSPTSPIVDTHTHLALTFESYRRKYPDGQYQTAWDFVRALYAPAGVEQMVDVWMEAPVRPIWRQYADSALTEEGRRDLWGGVGYWFVMGVHPHNAKHYTDKVEADIIEAMAHPRCVGWGEMGLDYHYDTSPRPVQREVFARQLRCAVRLNKPLTIHSREADADTERILKDEVPKNHKIHIHCFTDAPAFAQRLLDWFPNLYVGVTGVVTYSSNTDTSTTIRNMFASSNSTENLRIVLETDAPYMIPSTIYATPSLAGKKTLCATAACFHGRRPSSLSNYQPRTRKRKRRAGIQRG